MNASQVNLDENRGPQMRALLIAMLILPTIAVILRFWSRAMISEMSSMGRSRRFWWDDWTALVAVITNLAVCGIGLGLVDVGFGRHVQVVSEQDLTRFLKLLWIEYFVFDTGTALAKTSALFFYARIFQQVQSRFRYALYLLHLLNALWLIGIFISCGLECSPIEKAWMPNIPGTCVNTRTLWLGSGIPSLIIDVLILLAPMPMIWRLHMNLMRKCLVIGVFLCGYLVVVVSIGRLVTILQSGDALDLDPTYSTITPIFWLGSEIPISIISICLPSIFSLIRRMLADRQRHSQPIGRNHGDNGDSSTALQAIPSPAYATVVSNSPPASFEYSRKPARIHVRSEVTVS